MILLNTPSDSLATRLPAKKIKPIYKEGLTISMGMAGAG